MTTDPRAVNRRHFLGASAVLALAGGTVGCATPPARFTPGAKVVVIGGGYAGATAAKYVRLLSDGQVDVTLVEPNADFISCPISNLVLGGSKQLGDLTLPYTGLSLNHGVRLVRDEATAIDTAKRTVRLARGATLSYDKLVVAPGIELVHGAIDGLQQGHDAGLLLQAWKAGPETVALRRQLEAMPDGGVYAITIPEVPYRCPPGPYERACQVAWYFKQHKRKSKVLVLDANPDVTSKGALFKKVWAEQYAGIVEFRGQHKLAAVDAQAGLLKFEVQSDVKADVLNVLPPQRAGKIAQQAGLNNLANHRWCGVNYQTFESLVAKDVFVVGDSIQLAAGMPKSGHMANSHGKVAAAAIVAQLAEYEVNPQPVLTNTCYSFVDDRNVIHVASVHEYVAAEKTFKPVAGAGGLSATPNELEGAYAFSWARNIWADTLV